MNDSGHRPKPPASHAVSPLNEPQIPHGYFVPISSQYEEDEINLIDLWRIVANRKWLIAMITAVATIVATSYAVISTPVYRADVLLSPVTQADKAGGLSALASQFGGLANLAGINIPSASSDTETAIATIESRAFTQQFINKFNLKPALFADAWDAEQGRWRAQEPSMFASIDRAIKSLLIPDVYERNDDDREPGPSDWEAHQLFDEIRSVSQDSKSGLVTLSIDWTNPQQAASWANAIVQLINRHFREKSISQARKSIDYLQERLKETSFVDLRQVVFRLIEEHTKRITLANVTDEFVFEVVDPAVVPERPVKPKRKLIVVLGIVLGLMAGTFLAFVVHLVAGARATSKSEAGN